MRKTRFVSRHFVICVREDAVLSYGLHICYIRKIKYCFDSNSCMGCWQLRRAWQRAERNMIDRVTDAGWYIKASLWKDAICSSGMLDHSRQNCWCLMGRGTSRGIKAGALSSIRGCRVMISRFQNLGTRFPRTMINPLIEEGFESKLFQTVATTDQRYSVIESGGNLYWDSSNGWVLSFAFLLRTFYSSCSTCKFSNILKVYNRENIPFPYTLHTTSAY